MQTEPQSSPLVTALSAQEASADNAATCEWTIVHLGPFRPVLESCGVRIINEHKAQIDCPGFSLHNSDTPADSCIILYNGRWLRAYCFRNCCRRKVQELNRRLFHLASESGNTLGLAASSRGYRQQDPAVHNAWQHKQREREELERQAIALFPAVQRECQWPADAIKADSPKEITLSAEQHYRYILHLFEDDDIVWCADELNRTGSRWHAKHFQRASRWSGKGSFPGAFTCPSTFVPGSFSRCESNVAVRKFLVVESDNILDRDHVGAVFRWLDKHLHLPLRAVVDTGRRSLHGWFEYPSERLLEKLEVILPAVGCDRAMFRPYQPCRMPGVRRPETGRWQELLYLAPPPSGSVNTSADFAASTGGTVA